MSLYLEAKRRLNKKGAYKLANLLAHGYRVQAVYTMGRDSLVVVQRTGQTLMVDDHGTTFKVTECL